MMPVIAHFTIFPHVIQALKMDQIAGLEMLQISFVRHLQVSILLQKTKLLALTKLKSTV